MGHHARILALTAAVAMGISGAAAASRLRYASDVPKSHQKRLEADFERFREIPAIGEDPLLLSMLEIQSPSTEAISDWILARVKVVTGKDFNTGAPGVTVTLREGVVYPQREELPWGVVKGELEDPLPEPGDQPKTVTVMSNLGGALYLDGKLSGNILGVYVPGIPEPLEILSPRVGLVQIDQGLFTNPEPDRLAARLHRVSTMLHEARHSDGTGKSLGFFHFVCPDGHDYAGQEACDVAQNGPYAIEGRALKLFASTCGARCTKKEKEMLRLEAAEMAGRVFPALPAFSGEGAM
ncbi:MAG: hypothetical protein HUU37_06590, partial [Bdellovibrionales bacterium]|nr:hypothetical protein [Bdellovibrionales bacterium]